MAEKRHIYSETVTSISIDDLPNRKTSYNHP